jgi:hypothetical protein
MSATIEQLKKNVLAAESKVVECDANVERQREGAGELLEQARKDLGRAQWSLRLAENRAAAAAERKRQRESEKAAGLLADTESRARRERQAREFVNAQVAAIERRLETSRAELLRLLREAPAGRAIKFSAQLSRDLEAFSRGCLTTPRRGAPGG